jgi:heavy metal sensor kinase
MLRNCSLRTRMMLLFCAAVGVLLAFSYFGFYALFARQVRAQLDRQLLETSRPVIADLISDPTEQDVNQLNVPDNYFEVLDASGRALERSVNLRGSSIPGLQWHASRRQATFETVKDLRLGELRVVMIPFERGNTQQIFVLAVPTRDAEEALAGFRHISFLMFPLSLLLMAVISGGYVGRSLRPVADLTDHAVDAASRAIRMTPLDLWTPLEVANPNDELGRLAETFNRLFSKVNSALLQLRQFVSDASHELRTPLAVLRGETELVLSEPRSPEEYRKALGVIEEELKKLSHITEGLFTLALADAGELRIVRQPLYLNEVAEEACLLATPMAQAKGVVIDRRLDAEVPYAGDEAFLRQLFLIFLDNAIKYSPAGARTRVGVERQQGAIRIIIQDEGPGIPREHQPHIFKRFYRAPSATSDETRSGGLGLAIATAIVTAHGGLIECQSDVGKGSTFTVQLPDAHSGPVESRVGAASAGRP